MCKLLIMTGITEGLVAREFMERMAKPMSASNSHGIGYAAVGPDGELFSQRWLNNDHFFDTKDIMTLDIAEQLAPYASRLPKGALDPNYSELGNIDFENVRSVTMHTRFATCGREFVNTHPFIYEDTSLIHNGVIRNAFDGGGYYKSEGLNVNKISSCDSEAGLQTYLAEKVNVDTSKAKAWLDLLTGGWAFGILARNAQGNRILDVVRGISMLYYMEIEGIGKVFTTNDDDAKAVVKDMGLTFTTEPFFVASNEMYRYDAITGEQLESVDIKPKYSYNSSSDTKTYGRTTGTSSGKTSSSQTTTQTSQESKRPGDNLLSLVDAVRGDPDALTLLPDIFTEKSTIKDLKIDFRKVKQHCNDQAHPILDRLDIFDLVFNSSYRDMYEKFPTDLREFIRDVDKREGLKSARGLIKELFDKRKESVG